jgi:hypothetical protein
MKKYIILSIFIVVCSIKSWSQQRLFAVRLEGNLMQISNDIKMHRLGVNYVLGVDYYLTRKMYAGIFYSRMKDQSSNIFYLIDNKVIDLTNTDFANYGISAGYRVFKEERLSIESELRLGYGNLKFNTANFNLNAENNNWLTVDMFTISPRVNFNYHISSLLSMGMSGSYFFPVVYKNRTNLKEYNLNNINVGVYMKVNL